MHNISNRVRLVLRDCFGLEDDFILKDELFIVKDLDAASIDFLDISFQLEREFSKEHLQLAVSDVVTQGKLDVTIGELINIIKEKVNVGSTEILTS